MAKFRSVKGLQYKHVRKGDVLKIEIRDATYRLLYRKKIDIHDKQSLRQVLKVLESFGDLKIRELFEKKIEDEQNWW